MAKRRYRPSAATIEKKLKNGFGQGEGINYKPWLVTQNVTSIGNVSRIRGIKIERTHHFMSQLEARYFYIFEWMPQVVDIREQYPLLPQEITLDLAEQCGVRHPVHPKTQHPIVMTCDFLLTVREGGRTKLVARTIKPSAELTKKRVLEKFEIERRYWRLRDIDWGILTEQQLNVAEAKNLQLIRQYHDLTDRLNGHIERLPDIISALTRIASSDPHQTLIRISRACDDYCTLSRGTSLTVVYYLLWTRRWLADLTVPLNPASPVASLRILEVA